MKNTGRFFHFLPVRRNMNIAVITFNLLNCLIFIFLVYCYWLLL